MSVKFVGFNDRTQTKVCRALKTLRIAKTNDWKDRDRNRNRNRSV